MRMENLTKLDHEPPALSNPEPSDGERDNQVRYRPEDAARGHVESHFLKANSPDGQRALWIKHTLLVPRGQPEAAIAELWAIAFDARGTRKVAAKQTYPLAQLETTDRPFSLRVPDAMLTNTRAEGSVADASAQLAWSLALLRPEGAAASFRPFPYPAMYTGSFPRSKSLTPSPDLRIHGSAQVGDETWSLVGWRGAQGHNWGRSHAHAYAWIHANAWCEGENERVREGVWVEALSGRVRLGGRLVTPLLSVAAIAIDGEIVRFDGPTALFSRKVRVSPRSYEFTLSRPGATLEAMFQAQTPQFAGLRYVDPDGRDLACLNCKLAEGTLRLTRGRTTLQLRTAQAALELGTRDPAHGIAILA